MNKAKRYLEDKKTIRYIYTDYIKPVKLKSGGYMVGGANKHGTTYSPENVDKALEIAYLEGKRDAHRVHTKANALKDNSLKLTDMHCTLKRLNCLTNEQQEDNKENITVSWIIKSRFPATS